jgi:hypothetical protein
METGTAVTEEEETGAIVTAVRARARRVGTDRARALRAVGTTIVAADDHARVENTGKLSAARGDGKALRS